MTFEKSENWILRAKVIEDAKKAVEEMPAHQRESLRCEFDRAEEEAESIRTFSGPSQ